MPHLQRPEGDTLPVGYRIEGQLLPEHKEVRGTARVSLRNTTDQPLRTLRFHLYLNAFASGETLFMRSSAGRHRRVRADPRQPGWIRVRSLRTGKRPAPYRLVHDGTVLHVDLPEPIAPGEVVELNLRFVSRLPGLFARTGHAGDLFMIAQWYPKLGFLRGDGTWHCPPFHANAEFFAPFGRYSVSLTLPHDYVVGATGVEVQRVREGSRQRVVYEAEAVHDFALVAWPHFKEQHQTLAGVPVRLLSVEGRAGQRQRLLWLLGEALNRLQRRFGRYPYPQLTVVDLPLMARGAAGMEYPTLFTTMLPSWTPSGLHLFDEITVHELTHQYFQGIVASNETDEPWLDEGLTSYVSGVLLDEMLGADRSFIDLFGLRLGQAHKNALAQLRVQPPAPVAKPAHELGSWRRYASTVYGRAASLMYTLDGLIGKQRLMRALAAFVKTHAFGHPTGLDLRQQLVLAAPQRHRQVVRSLLRSILDDGRRVDVGLHCEHGRVIARRRTQVAIPLSVGWQRRDGTMGQRAWPTDLDRIEIRDPDLRRAWIGPSLRLTLDDTPLDNHCRVQPNLAAPVQLAGWVQQVLQWVGP